MISHGPAPEPSLGACIIPYQAIQQEYHLFIVTNRHVLQDRTDLVVRFNPSGPEPSRNYIIPLYNKTGASLWTGHKNPDIDLAAIGIDANFYPLMKSSMIFQIRLPFHAAE